MLKFWAFVQIQGKTGRISAQSTAAGKWAAVGEDKNNIIQEN